MTLEFSPVDPNDQGVGLGANDAGASHVVLQATEGGTLIVPGGAFLLTADYARIGPDLVLSGGADGGTVVVRDFFALDHAPSLRTEGGAEVAADLAARLAGSPTPGQYAAADDLAGQEPIGKVTELVGETIVTRVDGTTTTLAKDMAVFQGDVIETSDGAALKLVFVDESTLAVGENGRMVLDELVFDASSLDGSSAVSVLQGLFVFVSGQIAQNNPEQMLVRTPVALIGVRGTSVTVQAAQEGEDNKVILLPEQTADGQKTIGAVRVSNEAGAVVLDDAYETTVVDSVFSELAEPYLSSPEEVAFLLRRLMDAMPDALDFLTPIRSDADAGTIGSGDARLDAAADVLSTIAPAAGPPEGAPSLPDSLVDVTETNLVETASFAQPFEPDPAPPVAPITLVAPPSAPADTTLSETQTGGSTGDNGLPPAPIITPPPPVSGGATTIPAGLTKLADSFTTNGNLAAGVPTTGYTNASLTFASGGTFLIAWGAFDEDDMVVESPLLLDNVRLNGTLLDSFENAQFTNGGFSIPAGADVSFGGVLFSVAPTQGTGQLMLNGAALTAAQAEILLGLAPGTLNALADDGNGVNGLEVVTDGSLLLLQLAVSAGDTLSFDFNFIDIENDGPGGTFNDIAFVYTAAGVAPPANNAPTAVSFANTTTSIAENTDTTSGLKVADIVVNDDGLGTNALALVGADAASFEIVGTELRLKAGVLNFEATNVYSVQVTANDPTVGGNPDATSLLFTVSVTNLNEAPVVTQLAGPTAGNPIFVAENTLGTFITVTATDPENQALSFSIGANPDGSFDNTFFTVDATTGALSFINPPDFEFADPGNDDLYKVRVTVTDSLSASTFRDYFVQVTNIASEVASAGDDSILGTAIADVIDALAGNDTIAGLSGDDMLAGNAGNDLIDGGPDNDTVSFADSTAGVHVIIRGEFGSDVLGTETVTAGNGYSTALATEINAGTTLNAAFPNFFNVTIPTSINALIPGPSLNMADYTPPPALGANPPGTDILRGIENVFGSPFSDFMFGSDASNILFGNDGNDLIFGEAGADFLSGGNGADLLVGDLHGTGTAGTDILLGDAGNDILLGDGAEDFLIGGEDSDQLVGGADSDIYVFLLNDGSNQLDVILDSSGAADTIDFELGIDIHGLTSNGNDLEISFGTGNLLTIKNHFTTGTVEHVIAEDNGQQHDFLLSASHTTGTTGDDVIVGDNGASNTMSGDDGRDIMFGGAFADLIDGGTGNDNLFGNGGADTLIGGIGDDELEGGAGVDVLTGGADADLFDYRSAGDGTAANNDQSGLTTGDQITDFTSGTDQFAFFNGAFGFGSATGSPIDGSNFFTMSGFDGTNVTASDQGEAYFVFDTASRTLYHDDGFNSTGYTVIATVQAGGVVAASDVAIIAN